MAVPSANGMAIPPRTFHGRSSKNKGKYFDLLPDLCSRTFAGAVKSILFGALLRKSVLTGTSFQHIIYDTVGIHRKLHRPYHV